MRKMCSVEQSNPNALFGKFVFLFTDVFFIALCVTKNYSNHSIFNHK